MTLEGNYYNDISGDFNDPSVSPLATQVGSPQSPPQSQYLSNEEFDSLNKAVQLLRISQLRYIVQKFSIPASGNKTKLLNLVLSIFQSLRYDKVLIDILQEINNLLAQQRDAFSNPLASIGHLEVVPIDPSYFSPPNPMNIQSDPPYILGPIAAPPGQSNGQFSFMYSANRSVNISFLFPGGNPQTFTFQADLNGYPFEISGDDPYPQPIDISHILNVSNMPNTLNIKNVSCQGSMLICIREYRFRGVQDVTNQICGRIVNINDENPMALSAACHHSTSFSLVAFLSRAFGTGNWNCPICGQLVDLNQIKITCENQIAEPIRQMMPLLPPPMPVQEIPTQLSAGVSMQNSTNNVGGGSHSGSMVGFGHNMNFVGNNNNINSINNVNNINMNMNSGLIMNTGINMGNVSAVNNNNINNNNYTNNSSNNTSNPTDLFQQQTSDIFGSFDWDNF